MKLQLTELLSGSDVRGYAMEPEGGANINLTNDAAMKIGYTFGKWLQDAAEKNDLRVAVGRDSRLTGPNLMQAVMLGLVSRGIHVFDLGLSTTPEMFMTTQDEKLNCDAAVMITASHMPKDRNGIKMVTKAGGLSPADVRAILEEAEDIQTDMLPGGHTEVVDYLPEYAARLAQTVRTKTGLEKPLEGAKIVVDAGNGAGGYFTSGVLEPLGADTTGSRYLDPDGAFPNHIPNPEDEAAIASIEEAVLESQADMGIIFDTDVDRSAIVDEKGRPINKSAFIAFIASLILADHPGSTIVTDSVTSDGLTEFITAHGGVHHRFKRGYKNVIDEAKRLNEEGTESCLAMETSGHGAVKENYFLDDGSYLAVLALAAFAKAREKGLPVSEYLASYHYPAEEKEIRYTIHTEDFRKTGEELLTAFKAFAQNQPGWHLVEPSYEGVRAAFNGGWILVRLSLHEPKIPVNIESDVPGGIEKIEKVFAEFMKQFPDVQK